VSDLRALALIYDIRGFTAASKRLKTADLGSFATAAHRVILDLFAAHPPTFVKNLGDGHLLLWECSTGLDPGLVDGVVEGAQRARTAFAAFATAQRAAGQDLPSRVGIGVAFGEVARSDDYYGKALNLASRLQGVARPEGLALDQSVFEAVTARNERLKAVFKRARVRLKGFGSTLVWVDRPFSWARVLAPVWKTALVLVLPLAYVLLSDAGLDVPGGGAIRRWLDARDASLLRPVASDVEVRASADAQRRRLTGLLMGSRTPEGWVPSAFGVAERDPDLWSIAQSTYALFQAPHLSVAELRSLLPAVRVFFEPGRLVIRDGEPDGWNPHPGDTHTEVEPTLWCVAMVASALRRPGLLAAEERPEFERYLSTAQRAAMVFHPLEGGAWNIFPRQKDLARHSPYSTTLALLALLETHAAAQPWNGSVELRDRLLADTAAFLVRLYEPAETPAGWRRTADASDKVSPGLTMQILAELLWAEKAAGIHLPGHLVAAIPGHLLERADRGVAEAYDMGEFRTAFMKRDVASGKDVEVSHAEGINFLWHPWAIECAVRWLERARARGAPRIDEVRVRRSLGQFVVDKGDEAVRSASTGAVFVASETLIGLSRVPPPGPP
jgi:class 3 adenylate cyclase